jgi:hypothetical protein
MRSAVQSLLRLLDCERSDEQRFEAFNYVATYQFGTEKI